MSNHNNCMSELIRPEEIEAPDVCNITMLKTGFITHPQFRFGSFYFQPHRLQSFYVFTASSRNKILQREMYYTKRESQDINYRAARSMYRSEAPFEGRRHARDSWIVGTLRHPHVHWHSTSPLLKNHYRC